MLALLLAAAWLMGLGNGTDKGESSIPIPQRTFSVRLTDAKGLTMDANRFTWEGKVFLRANYGSATIILPFEKLKSIKVLSEKKTDLPDLIAAAVELKSGEKPELTVERSSTDYGETRFGNYEIFFKNVPGIVFK